MRLEDKQMEWKVGQGGPTTDLRLQTIKSMQPPTSSSDFLC